MNTLIEILQACRMGVVFYQSSLTHEKKIKKVYQFYSKSHIFVFDVAQGESYLVPAKEFDITSFETEELYSVNWIWAGLAPMLDTQEIFKLLPGC